MRRLLGALTASGFVAATVMLFPVSASALTVPNPISPLLPGISLPTSLPQCKPPPPIRSSATGVSAMFDGAPADTGGAPAQSTYEQYGVHAFSWSVYDPGCAGDIAQPIATVDTYIGDLLLGAATDLVALANGVHNLVFHPTWLKAFDRFESNAVSELTTNVWFPFLPVSVILVGLLVLTKGWRGSMAEVMRLIGWAVLVMAAVTVAFHYPTAIGHVADRAEVSGADTVASGFAGSSDSPSAVGSLEVRAVLYPAWANGEIGSSTDATALQYGPKLLDSEAYKWSEQHAGRPDSAAITKAKHSEFSAAATAINRTDPGAYTQLQGQANGRVVAGLQALGGAILTVPFRLVADLMLVAAMLIVRFEVMILPAVGVVALHHRYRDVLIKGVLGFTGGALMNAFGLAILASIDTVFSGFVLDPANGLPLYFGLIVSGVASVLLWTVFRKLRQVGRHDLAERGIYLGRRVTEVAAGGLIAGPAGAAAAAAGMPVVAGQQRQRANRRERIPAVTPPPPAQDTAQQPSPAASPPVPPVRGYHGPNPYTADRSPLQPGDAQQEREAVARIPPIPGVAEPDRPARTPAPGGEPPAVQRRPPPIPGVETPAKRDEPAA